MTNHHKTRMDPRIIRTRQLIKDAFIDLIQEMDIDKISVNRIADRATINRVTFYLHYRDIPDLMEKMADDMAEELQQVISDNSELQRTEDTHFVPVLGLLEHIAEHAKFYKVVLGLRRTPVFSDRLLKIVVASIHAKIHKLESDSFLAKADIQKDIAVWFGSSALIGTIVSWLRHDMPYTPQYLAKQFSLLVFYTKK
ncbi:MAG: TetR family transcriptional regulator [Paenibacillus sp.]|nr:TetR family transcriptional regulator [Paenibacillus sp.]